MLVFCTYFEICLSEINIYICAKYLCFVEDLHDASIMPVASSGNPLFSVRNLQIGKQGNLSSFIWGAVFVDIAEGLVNVS